MSDAISRTIFDQIHKIVKENPDISDRELARCVGVDRSTVNKWRNRPSYPEPAEKLSAVSTDLSDGIHKWLRQHKREVSIDEISDHFDVAVGRVRKALQDLRDQKKSIAIIGESRISADSYPPQSAPTRIDVSRFGGKTVRIGVCSDEHLCLHPATPVITDSGPKSISAIKAGDKVLTHKGRFKKVTSVVTSRGNGKFIRIWFRSTSMGGSDLYSSMMATPNHPVQVVRNGQDIWMPLDKLSVGDIVRVRGKKCAHCGELTTPWFKSCRSHDFYCNPYKNSKTEQKKRNLETRSESRHFRDDISPEMLKWQKNGWRIIPVDRARPDFIAVRDGQIVAVEIEAPQRFRPQPFYEKYGLVGYKDYYDEVRWIIKDPRTRTKNLKYDYIAANEYGFVGCYVTHIDTVQTNEQRRTVYNLKVDDDESYVAKNVVVHNCSKYHRDDCREALFDIWEQQGIKDIYSCGNMIDGEASFNKHDLLIHGMQNQVDYYAEHWPARDGMTTHFVTGDDHEGWYCQREGINIGEYIQMCAEKSGRNDLKFLGHMEHDVIIAAKHGEAVMRVMHAGGGSAYATCFDAETEIFTECGWRKFPDLSSGCRVATLNTSTNTFEWQIPTEHIAQPYDGDMLHFKARCFDLMVTPNHRMYAKRHTSSSPLTADQIRYPKKSHKKINRDWHFVPASTLNANFCRQSWHFKRGGQSWNGINADSVEVPRLKERKFGWGMRRIGIQRLTDIAEIIAWYVTEGNIDGKCKTTTITQSHRVNPENYKNIVSLVERLGLHPCQTGDKSIHIGSRELAEYLRDNCGEGSYHKYLPQWLKACSQEILRLVFDTMIAGDGWKNGTGTGYKSFSPRLRADMTEIAVKLGYAVTENKESLSISSQQIYPTVNTAPLAVPYNGIVYCVSVPNETILVRRNGRAVWCGNSYSVQKIAESLTGGTKPGVMLVGHYHKAEYSYARNIHIVQAACFTGNASVVTPYGLKRISRVQCGDYVKTHLGRFRKVTNIFKRRYAGPLLRIYFGRDNSDGSRMTATPEHPIYTKTGWQPIESLLPGDSVLVDTVACIACKSPIPYFLKMCRNCNPMDMESTRIKLSKSRGGFKRTRQNSYSGQIYLETDIIPFCESLISDGWKIVPVGAKVIPDAIGFKDGKVVAFELERTKGNFREYKERKYDNAHILRFVDEVRWVDIAAIRKEQPRSSYEVDSQSGLAWVKVRSRKLLNGRSKRAFISVYNLEVEDDNSYLANRAAVHNCLEDQTPFMRKRKIQAHVGGWTVSFDIDDFGNIHAFTPQFHPFYDREFYEKNWQYLWKPVNPVNGILSERPVRKVNRNG